MLHTQFFSMQSHPAAIGLYGKPFPHFDRLDVAFGKDRATGDNGEGPAEAAFAIVQEFYERVPRGESGFNLDGDENNSESQIPETSPNNTTQSQRDATAYRSGKRGGKRVKYNDDVADSLLSSLNKLGEFYAGTVENIQ